MPSFLSRLFGAGANPRAPEAKTSRAQALLAMHTLGAPRWSARDYTTLAFQGYERNAVVYRCVRMIAEAAASVPWRLYDGRAEVSEHPLLDLFNWPNPKEAGPVFLETVFSNLLIYGNAYVEAALVDGGPRELYALRPDRVQLVPGRNGWPAAYDYSFGGETARYVMGGGGIDPVLHLKLFHPLDDHYGFPPLAAAQIALDTHNAASAWNKALLDNAARPSGALVFSGADNAHLSDEQFARLKAELDENFQGPLNAGRPLLLEGGLDWKALSLSPHDMDFGAAKAAAARDIALAFGVPPLMLGMPGDNTHANFAEANRSLWRQTVIPLVSRTLKSFSQWLAPSFGGPLRLDYDVDRIEALAQERAQEWSRIDAASFLSQDEKREAAGYGRLAAVKAGQRAPERRYSPSQPSDDHGRWSGGGGGGELNSQLAANFFKGVGNPVNLSEEEAPNGIGHSIEDHVGQSDQQLLDRLDRMRSSSEIFSLRITDYATAVGTFRSLGDANAFINEALRANADVVNSVSGGTTNRATIDYRVGSPTGVEACRPSGQASGQVRPTYGIRVILWHMPGRPRGFGIRTAFPVNALPRLPGQ